MQKKAKITRHPKKIDEEEIIKRKVWIEEAINHLMDDCRKSSLKPKLSYVVISQDHMGISRSIVTDISDDECTLIQNMAGITNEIASRHNHDQ